MAVNTRIYDQYLATALWTASLDSDFNIFDFSPEARQLARDDLEAFISEAGDLLCGLEPYDIGHNFWLTRNRHGTGFWDRELGALGQKLIDISHNFRELSLYVTDDGAVSFEH